MSLKKTALAGLASLALAMGGSSTALPLKAEEPPITEQQKIEPVKFEYDINNTQITQRTLDELLDSTYQIWVETTYQKTRVDGRTMETVDAGTEQFYGRGSGVVYSNQPQTVLVTGLSNNFQITPLSSIEILTCNHLRGDMPDQLWDLGFSQTSPYATFYQKTGEKYYLVHEFIDGFFGVVFTDFLELELVKSDEQHDLMLLKSGLLAPQEAERYHCFSDLEGKLRIADEASVKPGNIVYTVGYPTVLGKQLTQGIISGVSNPNQPNYENIFYVTSAINFGNSGGPNFIFLNGQPHLVGLSQYKFGRVEGVYGIIKPSVIQKFLEPEQKPEEDIFFEDW
ncbi:hypothetical protein COV11_04250 [Candidatus Woesearchaeota archaeon CG10_big_fil_rev_8_21_14_0_10_30_7]|nr:MAG: hypothetical protein COV11_04250 [Candidatus Woesearchaeota archaeon CG10_big_fil_rev_8_21_14_0_10_30_7]